MGKDIDMLEESEDEKMEIVEKIKTKKSAKKTKAIKKKLWTISGNKASILGEVTFWLNIRKKELRAYLFLIKT